MIPNGRIGSVEHAVDMIQFPDTLSQHAEEIEARSRSCIFVGAMHNSPYFIDFGLLMNPHIFICGVTGSGKTYLMRNLMLKLWAAGDATLLVLDFTGEYAAFASFAGEESSDPENIDELMDERKDGMLYFGMKGITSEQDKVRTAESIMGTVVERMRASNTGGRVFLLLDEAWKLLRGSASLETLLREGRKYGYGLVFSSQLLEDIDLAMLSNAATVFLFRLQNRRGLDRLAVNYGLAERHVAAIQDLAVGSCMAVQVLATGRRSVCMIEKVHGIEVEDVVRVVSGGSMMLEIGRRKFENCIRENCGAEALRDALALNSGAGRIELAALVSLLLKHSSGDAVLAAMRELAVDEGDIAAAFAVALIARADANGT